MAIGSRIAIARAFGDRKRGGQMIEEFSARDVFGAEGHHMGGGLLTP